MASAPAGPAGPHRRLGALAIGSFLTAAGLPTGGAERIGDNVPVDPAVAGDPTRLDANNSPSLARSPVDPARLAVANRIDSTEDPVEV